MTTRRHGVRSAWVLLACVLVHASAWAALVINEVCYDNSSFPDESGGKTSDWIELYNNGTTATNVYNFGLADTNPYDEAKGVRLPSYWLAPGDFLVVYASTDLSEHTAWTNAPNQTVIPENSAWRYLTPSDGPAATWKTNTFVDASWPVGLSPLGYNDAKDSLDCATVLGYGGAAAARYPSAYFRRSFVSYKPWTVTGMVMKARLNDGAVIYLNGREVYRHNMPSGAVAYDTLAAAAEPSTLWTTALLATNGLIQGTNVIAVEVHQASVASSDLVMDLSLTALINEQVPFVHGYFGLAKAGEKVHLFNSALTRIHEFDAPTYEIGANNSYGLAVDGAKSSGSTVFTKSTPGKSNTAHATKYQETLTNENLSFSVPPGVYAAGQHVALHTATAGLKVYYTLDGSDPRDSSTFVYSGAALAVDCLPDATSGIAWIRTNPPEISNNVPTAAWAPPVGGVGQATVIRALAVSVDGTQCSPEIWGTYLIGAAFTNRVLPIVSLIAYTNDFFGFTNGIYVPGKAYADSPAGYGDNRWGKPYANYHQDSSDSESWERPVKFELVETSATTPAVSQLLGVSMHGGGTRAIPEKTLYLLSRLGEYGSDRVNYKLFPDESPSAYKRFLLRNSGNDWYGPDTGVATMLKDAVFHRLVDGLDVSVMAYRPTVAYLNGQYWGIHNLRESFDKHYLATHYGVEADNCDILMHEEDSDNPQKVVFTRIDGDKAADDDYATLMGWVSSNSLSVAANYLQLQTWVDVTNLADYVIAETFFANTDWPINNCDFWRTHTNQVATCGQYGDTRWRWMLYDLDVAGEQGASYDMFDYLSDKDMVDVNEPGFLINKLWKNMSYRNYFVTRYANLLNTAFCPRRTAPIIQGAAQTIAPEIETHFRRWGRTFTQDQWQSAVNTALVEFVSARHEVLWSHLNKHFNLGGTGALTVRNSDLGGVGGHFVVNGFEIETTTAGVTNRASWSGTFFQSLGVTVKAVPDSGYVFVEWEDDAGAGAERTVFVTTSPVTYVARFLPEGAAGCTVTFDPQGGTVDPTNKYVAVGGTYGVMPTPTRDHYVFAGWVDGESRLVSATNVVSGSADHTLYASWSFASYVVSFDAQGGSVEPASKSVTYSATYGTLPTPARTGYLFGGWWTDVAGAGSRVESASAVALSADQTLYAAWTAETYVVSFDAQGGSVEPSSMSVTFDAAYGTLPTPTFAGHLFGGWWTAAGGSGALVVSNVVVSTATNHTLYAKWTSSVYQASFDAQGGSVSPASKSIVFGCTFGELPLPVRGGYAFAGWWTAADGAGSQVEASTEVTSTADVTLYASWTAILHSSVVRAITDTHVTLTVTPAVSNAAWICTETFPLGLAPVGIKGENVAWDADTRTLTWCGTGAIAVVQSYGVIGGVGAYTLSGAATFDDASVPTEGDSNVTVSASATVPGWRYPRGNSAGTFCASESTTVPVTTKLAAVSFVTNVTGRMLTGDVDGDGGLELITADGELRAVRGDGQQEWFVSLPQTCFASMLEDVDGDGVLDIGLGSAGVAFSAYLYNGVGAQLKAFPGRHASGAAASVAPIGFSGPTVLMGYNATTTNALPRGVACFDYLSGDERWYAQVGPTNGGVFSVADADGDGLLDATMRSATANKGVSGSGATDSAMCAVSVNERGAVTLAQNYASPSNGVADHVFADLDGDGVCEIVGFESHDAVKKGVARIHAYATSGNEKAVYSGAANSGWASYAIGNLAGDDGLEIVATTSSGEKIALFDGALNKLIEKSGLGYVKLLCDLDGDGVLDVVTMNDKGLLRVLDARLNVIASAQAGSKMGTVIASDINGDGVVEILCSSDRLYTFAFMRLATPVVVQFAIDSRAATTSDRVVTLSNTCSNAPTYYMASESADFTGAEWQYYSAAPTFTLSDGAGAKTVYFKVRNAAGDSAVVSDSIGQPSSKPVVVALAINAGATGTNRRTVTLDNACTGVPTEYQACESTTFTGAVWQAYCAAPTFDLPSGKGVKAVYFRVRNASGTSAVKSDTIALDESGVQVTAVVSPAAGGTVTPDGGLATAGKPLALTAKASTGWVFTGWDNGSQSTARAVAASEDADADGEITATACFLPLTAIGLPPFMNPGSQAATVGVAFALPISVKSATLPTVTVSGLPAGLKYDASSRRIAGVPTKACTNVVRLTVSNVKGTAVPQAFTIRVAGLPAWAQGRFSGVASSDELGVGAASMSVTALGGVSGKVALGGTNYTFVAASYSTWDDEGALWLTSTAKVGRVALPLTVSVGVPLPVLPAVDVPSTLGKATGVLDKTGWVTLYRNVWKDPGLPVAATNFTGYYTATLPGGADFGSGYLALTVDAAGGVKSAGKLADGTSLSLSSSLVLDEAGGVWTVLCASPAAYKGGSFFGVAEWALNGGVWMVRPKNGDPFIWSSLNPQATATYGEGFDRGLGLSGGWYDNLDNLYDFYRGVALKVGTDAGAAAPVLDVGTNAYVSACWNPDGIGVSVVTNSQGVMTGVSAPRAGSVVGGEDGYDYTSETNTVGLSISLTTSTGLFKGSFKAWFDYPGSHVSKALSFEGLLTPNRIGDDGVEGRGFFLWSATGYQDPSASGSAYTVGESYDFLLLSE